MIITHVIADHKKHKKILLNKIEEFRDIYDCRLPSNYVIGGEDKQLLDTVYSDVHLEDTKPHIDYFFEHVAQESIHEVADVLKFNHFGDYNWQIHYAWFQQYLDDGGHEWHIHPDCQFTNIYFVELPDKTQRTEIMGLNGKLMQYEAVE